VGIDLDICVGLLPGQGGYRPGALGRAWQRREPAVTEVFGQIDEVAVRFTGQPVTGQIFSASPPSLSDMLAGSPDLLQLAIFGQSVAAFRLIEAAGGRLSCLVGHSLGEIAALVCAGAYTAGQGAQIICHRSAAVREAGAADGRMLALGADAAKGEEILHLLGSAGLVLAVDNGPGQIVISGPVADLQRVATIASAINVAATPLASPAPFHNSVLAPARRELARRISGIAHGSLRIPVYSPILSRQYRDSDDLPSLLGMHLVTPVRFGAAVSRLYDAGARIFVEVGAGSALTGLAAAAHPDVTVLRPLAGPDDEAALAQTVTYLAGRPAAPPATPAPPAWETPAAPRWDNGTTRLEPTPVPVVSWPPVQPAAPEPAAVSWPAPQAAAPAAAPWPASDDLPAVWAREGAADAPAPAARETTASAAAGGQARVTREEILRGVRALYAEALEYPEDVLTEDAEFEAHLGVDSLKQTEMFTRLSKRYAIPAVPEDVTDIDTIGKAVDFIYAALTAGAGKAA
jgi:[acyl-carrier-protein] S-malonyltransferase